MIQPLLDKILVKPEEAKKETEGGLLIPKANQETQAKGVVLAVGEGKEDQKMVLKEGDGVIFKKFAGTEIDTKEGKCLIMSQSDVLAKYEV